MKEMYLAAWDAAVSLHRGKMKTVIINLRVRFNQGVVSLNLPQIGILAKGDMEYFWQLLEERLSLCFEALMCRHRALEGVTSDVSPIQLAVWCDCPSAKRRENR